MAKPKMVIFDAGRTLLHHTSVSTLRGVREIMKYATENPSGYTAEEIDNRVNEIAGFFSACRKMLFEVPEQNIWALAFDIMRLKFSVNSDEIEEILWWATAEINSAPNAEKALNDLNAMGIKTAVISNLDSPSRLLKKRMDRVYPNNRFEFVIASSDYGIRKPNRLIFDAGIAKSGFNANEIWYVGDKIAVDVEGSKNAGMVPILYKSPMNVYDEIPRGVRAINDFSELTMLINAEE